VAGNGWRRGCSRDLLRNRASSISLRARASGCCPFSRHKPSRNSTALLPFARSKSRMRFERRGVDDLIRPYLSLARRKGVGGNVSDISSGMRKTTNSPKKLCLYNQIFRYHRDGCDESVMKVQQIVGGRLCEQNAVGTILIFSMARDCLGVDTRSRLLVVLAPV
jgi:hypothetical protein